MRTKFKGILQSSSRIGNLGFAISFIGTGLILGGFGILACFGIISSSIKFSASFDRVIDLIFIVLGGIFVYWGIEYWKEAANAKK